MDNYKLRIKLGEHEFEAEGPKEDVLQQFEEFKELIQTPHPTTKHQQPPGSRPKPRREEAPLLTEVETQALTPEQQADQARLAKVIHYDKKTRLISLTVIPQGEKKSADAVLLLLLATRNFVVMILFQ